MFKEALFIGLCIFVIAECKPSQEEQKIRVSRDAPNPISTGINIATQLAVAAAQGAVKAADMAKQAAQGVAQTAMNGIQKIPAALG